ncbi:MAG: HEAT repeat domain-containing protein, partial [Myxococcota bacterium]|nr:HEAT repeat domain-containing protein [Myxococcota bacterium]
LLELHVSYERHLGADDPIFPAHGVLMSPEEENFSEGLLNLLAEQANEFHQGHGVVALARTQAPEAEVLGRSGLSHEAPFVRLQSLSAFALIGDPEFLPDVQALVQDSDPAVARRAVEVAAQLERRGVLPGPGEPPGWWERYRLLRKVKRGDTWDTAEALVQLRRHPSDRVVARLRRIHERSDPWRARQIGPVIRMIEHALVDEGEEHP